jgi:hypothetical protein
MKHLSITVMVLSIAASLGGCATGGAVASSTRDRNIANAQGFLDDLLLHGEPDRAKARVAPNFEFRYVVADDRAVALLMDGDAEGRFGEYDNRYVFYFEFENGLIARLDEYNSDLLAMRSLWGYRLVAPE